MFQVTQMDGKFFSFHPNTDSYICDFGSLEQAQKHVDALNSNASLDKDGTNGLTLLRVAYTNEPHVALRRHPISIEEVNGEKFIKHPILVSGTYRYKDGQLDLGGKRDITDPEHPFNRIIFNHFAGIQDAGVYTRPHHKSDKAWSWLSPEHEGWLSVERSDDGFILVGYGKPTGEDKIKSILSNEYAYVSADLHTRYSSNKLEAKDRTYLLSSDNLMEVKVANSDKVFTLSTEEYQGYVKMEARLESAQGEIAELEEQVERYKKAYQEAESKLKDQDPEAALLISLSDEAREKFLESKKEMQEIRLELQRSKFASSVHDLCTKIKLAAKPDQEGKVIDAFTANTILEFISKGVKFGEDDSLVKLEDVGHENVVPVIKFLSNLVENMPRAVSSSTQTSGDERRLESSSSSQLTQEDLDFIQEIQASIGGVGNDH